MPIRHTLWKVGAEPTQLPEAALEQERQLEDMIVADSRILSDDWMLIGRQEDTGHGGRVDLLAMAPDGSLVLIELKRDRTPREVVAQVLDYATWLERLDADALKGIYARFAPGKSLEDEYRSRFNRTLDEESLNASHQLVILAASLDPSSERIVSYLSGQGVPINVLCFQVFASNDQKLLSRAWLLDPIQSQVSAAQTLRGPKEPWNGEFYVSFGHGVERSWEDARRLGFISGGGGAWYTRTLGLLSVGDRVWVNIPAKGYVGVGRVTGKSQPASSFTISRDGNEASILSLDLRATYLRDQVDDPERAEFFVPVHWLDTVPVEKAIHEVGFFGNQNTVCQPKAASWRHTVEKLKQSFLRFDQ